MRCRKQHLTSKSGFTLVELSFAIAFLSILLITIATVTLSVIAIYRKGNSIKMINSAGDALVSEFSSAVRSSPAGLDQVMAYQVEGAVENGKVRAGVFCTSKYVYYWRDDSEMSEVDLNELRLIRYPYSVGQNLCSEVNQNYDSITNEAQSIASQGTQLLENTEQALVIKDLTITKSLYRTPYNGQTNNQAEEITSALYSVSFKLATRTGAADIDATECSVEGGTQSLSSDFNYCALNTFNFVARATGG